MRIRDARAEDKVVYCKDSNRRDDYPNIQFDFLGYTFMPRQAKNGRKDGSFTNWLPAVSHKAMKSMREKMKGWKTFKTAWCEIEELAREINPVVKAPFNVQVNHPVIFPASCSCFCYSMCC